MILSHSIVIGPMLSHNLALETLKGVGRKGEELLQMNVKQRKDALRIFYQASKGDFILSDNKG